MAGPFDRIGVDAIQFPRTSRGNQCAVVFVDYLTKWPKDFAVPDQSAATITRWLVEEIVSRHGIPSEVLSDQGRAFLSRLMQEVERLLGFKKVTYTTAYHPQTDGLGEHYGKTLTAMLAKTVHKRGVETSRHPVCTPSPSAVFRSRVYVFPTVRTRPSSADPSGSQPEGIFHSQGPEGIWSRAVL